MYVVPCLMFIPLFWNHRGGVWFLSVIARVKEPLIVWTLSTRLPHAQRHDAGCLDVVSQLQISEKATDSPYDSDLESVLVIIEHSRLCFLTTPVLRWPCAQDRSFWCILINHMLACACCAFPQHILGRLITFCKPLIPIPA